MALWPLGKAKEKEPTSEEGVTEMKDGDPEEKKTPESNSDPPQTVTEVQSPFSHPGLEGKSEQEIVDLLALNALTIKEQSAAVAGIDSQPAVVAVEPEPKPEPVKISSEDFFLDPAEAIRKVTAETVSEVVQKEMKEIVAPLAAQLSRGFTKDAWEEAGVEVKNLSVMRPLIESVLKKNGIANPSVAQIVGASDLAYGQAARQGTPIPGMVSDTTTSATTTPQPIGIPQHSPSTQPLAQVAKTPAIEPLNEFEARIARENKQTPEEYRALQDLDSADVLAPVEETS